MHHRSEPSRGVGAFAARSGTAQPGVDGCGAGLRVKAGDGDLQVRPLIGPLATCPADCDGGTTLPEQPRGHVLRWDRLGDLIREYARSHRVTQFSAPRSTGPGQPPDHQAETRKLLATFAAMTLHMAADPGVRAAACEYARVWAGADLAERLRGPSRVLAGDPVGEAALLAAAVALTRRQPT
jgi:hypothetical protein